MNNENLRVKTSSFLKAKVSLETSCLPLLFCCLCHGKEETETTRGSDRNESLGQDKDFYETRTLISFAHKKKKKRKRCVIIEMMVVTMFIIVSVT